MGLRDRQLLENPTDEDLGRLGEATAEVGGER